MVLEKGAKYDGVFTLVEDNGPLAAHIANILGNSILFLLLLLLLFLLCRVFLWNAHCLLLFSLFFVNVRRFGELARARGGHSAQQAPRT